MNIKTSIENDPIIASQQYLQAAMELGKLGRNPSKLVLLQRAIDLHPTTAALRVAFSTALTLRKAQDASRFLTQITPMLSPNPKNKEWLAKAQTNLAGMAIDRAGIEQLLLERNPPAYEPIPKRICYILHNSLPYSSGGYATRAQGLAQGLTNLGNEVIVLTRPGFPADLVKLDTGTADIPEESVVEGIRYIATLEPSRNRYRGHAYIMESAEALKKRFLEFKPAVVIAASNHLTSLPAQIAARALGIPFIYEVRGFWEVTRWSREPEYRETKAYAELAALETLSADHADHVFTLTTPMKEELIERGVPAEQISLLPNSCDPSRFIPRGRDEELAAKLGIPANVPVIGYIGSFVQYEGLDHLAQACAILAKRGLDFRLMLVGNENVSGNDKGPITAEVERVAAEEGLASRLIMPGRVPHEEVEAYYSLIDVAPFPRKPQPVTEMVSPMKPLEAYAMGKAVVASSVRALTEMVEHEVTGMLFEKGNVEDLANVLESLIKDPEKRARFAIAGRAWVEEQRTWDKTAARAEAVLEKIRL